MLKENNVKEALVECIKANIENLDTEDLTNIFLRIKEVMHNDNKKIEDKKLEVKEKHIVVGDVVEVKAEPKVLDNKQDDIKPIENKAKEEKPADEDKPKKKKVKKVDDASKVDLVEETKVENVKIDETVLQATSDVIMKIDEAEKKFEAPIENKPNTSNDIDIVVNNLEQQIKNKPEEVKSEAKPVIENKPEDNDDLDNDDSDDSELDFEFD